uniref:Uncharacterized protein n=1 Tax=Arundo donax TaxID=35708 RepID=A0A0A9HLG1_ARUDO
MGQLWNRDYSPGYLRLGDLDLLSIPALGEMPNKMLSSNRRRLSTH